MRFYRMLDKYIWYALTFVFLFHPQLQNVQVDENKQTQTRKTLKQQQQ